MDKKKNPGTAFADTPVGTVHPKGTKIKRNPDGTITLIEPKKTTKKKGK